MAHEGLWEQLAGLDPQKTAQRAKCQYLADPERYIVTFLSTEYVVNLEEREIFSAQPGSQAAPAGFLEQLCILAYLINVQDLPLANELAKAEALAGGEFFFRGIHSLPTGKLEKAFGGCPEDLCEIAERFGAKRCEYGDASIELCVLPRVPLTLIIWRGDEEFPARASILFDRTAAMHMPLDALGTAVNLAVDAVIAASEQSS